MFTNTFHLCQFWNVVQHPLNSAELNRTMSDRDENVEALSVTVGETNRIPGGVYLTEAMEDSTKKRLNGADNYFKSLLDFSTEYNLISLARLGHFTAEHSPSE